MDCKPSIVFYHFTAYVDRICYLTCIHTFNELISVLCTISVGLSSRALAKMSLVSGFPRKKWVPFIDMHNGRVNDVTYCDNLGKKWVPPY